MNQSTDFTLPPANFSFVENEEQVLKLWKERKVYQEIVSQNAHGNIFNANDGPVFCSSPFLHTGHMHIAFMKNIVLNFQQMHGLNVLNKIGYDVHGLPTEQAVGKLLNIFTKPQVNEYGLAKYNKVCRDTINQYAGSWQPLYDRIARFVDFSNEYKTMDLNYMESVWWAFKQLWNKGLVYQGFRVMPYSTACGTPLSNFEASGDDIYKEVHDPAVFVKFKVKSKDNYYFVAWTTTPWTLPSNLALACHPNMKYVVLQDKKTNENYIMAESCIRNLYTPPKQSAMQQDVPYKILSTHLGKEFDGWEYEPILPYYAHRTFKIILCDYVDGGSGSGIVHTSPGHGEEDFNACIKLRVVTEKEVGQYCPVDDYGLFTDPVTDYKGIHVLECNDKIIQRLKQENKLLKKESIAHKYPHCWRTDTPLIYKAVSSFFIDVPKIRDQLIANNKKVRWVPEHIGTGRFHQWLENVRPWGVSRNRFFGTPIPVWISDDGEEMVCIGSIDELVTLANLSERPIDLHPEFINHIQIPSQKGKGMLKRTSDILDCWFESGSVPFAQYHYPFENTHMFDNVEFLSDFVCEGSDQVNKWFYTLMILSTAIFNKPAFKTVICNGLILAADGKKFAKRLGNCVDPNELINEYGADAMRLYLIGSPAAHADSFKFNKEDIAAIVRKYIQWFNGYKFLLEHIIKYKKDGNQFDINAYKSSTNMMDNWILSRIRTIIINIETEMKNYHVYKVVPEIMDFIEDLTNWYIKFNRNRLKGRVTPIEQNYSLSTLYHVIFTFSKIAAPFVPYLAETMYQQLKILYDNEKDKLSVHLCRYPKDTDYPNNNTVQRQMKRLQVISSIVRNLRTKSKISTTAKMPIKEVIVVHDDDEFLTDLQTLQRYMCEEINCIRVKYLKTIGNIKYTVEPNNKEIGLKYRQQAVQIKTALSKVSQDVLKTYMDSPDKKLTLKIDDHEVVLQEPLFVIHKIHDVTLLPTQQCYTENKLTIIADFVQDVEVTELFIKRLFVGETQKMRKEAKLKPWNKIGIYYKTNSQLVDQVINKFYDSICQELIYAVYEQDNMNKDAVIISTKEHNLHGHIVLVTITDVDNDFVKKH